MLEFEKHHKHQKHRMLFVLRAEITEKHQKNQINTKIHEQYISKFEIFYEFCVQLKSSNHSYFYEFILSKLLNIIIDFSHFAALFLKTLSNVSIDKFYCGDSFFEKM